MMSYKLPILPKTLACGLLFFFLPTFAADATGFVRYEDCSISEGNRIHLERFQGKALRKPIIFKVPMALAYVGTDFLEVHAMECTKPDNCEAAVKSRIQILHVSNVQEVSGNFFVEFQDGRKLEGSFNAIHFKPVKPLVCE
jgi:hypothetical protein